MEAGRGVFVRLFDEFAVGEAGAGANDGDEVEALTAPAGLC